MSALNLGDLGQGDQDALRRILTPDEYTWTDGKMCLNSKGMRHLCALVISGRLAGNIKTAKEMLTCAVLMEFGCVESESGTARIKPSNN